MVLCGDVRSVIVGGVCYSCVVDAKWSKYSQGNGGGDAEYWRSFLHFLNRRWFVIFVWLNFSRRSCLVKTSLDYSNTFPLMLH